MPSSIAVTLNARQSSERGQFQHHRVGLLFLVAPRECPWAWGRVSPAVAVLSFPSWADLTQVAGQLIAGRTAHGLQHSLYFSGAQGAHFSAHEPPGPLSCRGHTTRCVCGRPRVGSPLWFMS